MMFTTMRWMLLCAVTMISCACVFDSLSHPSGQTTATTSTVPLLFADDFEGSSLNLKKWYRCYADTDEKVGCSNNPGMELEWYQPGNVMVSGGLLHLVAREQALKPKFPLHFRANFDWGTVEAVPFSLAFSEAWHYTFGFATNWLAETDFYANPHAQGNRYAGYLPLVWANSILKGPGK